VDGPGSAGEPWLPGRRAMHTLPIARGDRGHDLAVVVRPVSGTEGLKRRKPWPAALLFSLTLAVSAALFVGVAWPASIATSSRHWSTVLHGTYQGFAWRLYEARLRGNKFCQAFVRARADGEQTEPAWTRRLDQTDQRCVSRPGNRFPYLAVEFAASPLSNTAPFQFATGRIAQGLIIKHARGANGTELPVAAEAGSFVVLAPDRASRLARLDVMGLGGSAAVGSCKVRWVALVPGATCARG
jgi:hypothetical protein